MKQLQGNLGIKPVQAKRNKTTACCTSTWGRRHTKAKEAKREYDGTTGAHISNQDREIRKTGTGARDCTKRKGRKESRKEKEKGEERG